MRKRLLPTLFVFLVIALVVGCRPTSTPEPPPPIETDTGLVPEAEEPAPQGEATEVPGLADAEKGGSISSTPTLTALERSSAVDELVAQLEGVSLRDFFEISFRALIMRSPETVLTVGLTEFYGVKDVRLDDISDAYQRETYQMIAAILEMLKGYDRAGLSPEDQISYDIYQWYLEDELTGREFMYHDYPATYYPITAVHEDLLRFFADNHPVADLQDAQDYVTRLGLVGTKIEQLIDNLKLREQAGIVPPQFAIQWSIYGSLGQFVDTPAKRTELYTAFDEKLAPLSSVTPEDKQRLLDEAEVAIDTIVLPAYHELRSYLSSLETYPGGDSGVWRLPQGEAYYTYRLRHFITIDLPADEIHQLGLDELERIHAAMRTAFDQLGYEPEETIAQAYNRVAQEGGRVSGNEVLETYERIISEADQNLGAGFDMRPAAEVRVVADQYGGYYVEPSIDGSRPGIFYAGVSGGREYYAMPTLAYHETIPGHHLQIALALEMKDLPSFRQGLSFTSYTEGWALYAENLAWELGWYGDDLYGYLGFLQFQAFRAARLVVDTGLHAKGWTFDQAQAFFTENTGFEVGDNINPQNEIARYMVWPGQSVSYYVGYLKLMELRQKAMDKLGDDFDLKAFHSIVLGNGSMPLGILERVIDAYIAEVTGE